MMTCPFCHQVFNLRLTEQELMRRNAHVDGCSAEKVEETLKIKRDTISQNITEHLEARKNREGT